MPKESKTAEKPPIIEMLKLSELTVEEGFNPREEKSFKANTAELVKSIEANGGIDPSIHVIQYVERGGKKLIRNGHTLYAAAGIAKIKEVPAIKTTKTRIQELTNLVRSNTGHPLSQREQGEVYARMRNGDEIEKVPVGAEALAPMSTKDIAAAIGCSTMHIENCLAIHEATPEVREMLEAGTISANAFVLAKNGVKNKDTVLKILRAAHKAAVKEGKDCATPKHVRAVKDEFVVKKQTAVSTKAGATPATDTPAAAAPGEQPAPAATETPAAGGSGGEAPAASGEATGTSTAPETGKKGKTKKDAPAPAGGVEDLGQPGDQPAPAPGDQELPMAADPKDTRALFIKTITAWAEETCNAPSNTEIELLADQLIAAATEKNIPI